MLLKLSPKKKMSDADRLQTSTYLNGIWKHLTNDVSKSRNVSVATLNQYADSMITFSAPAEYIKMKLVDKTSLYRPGED